MKKHAFTYRKGKQNVILLLNLLEMMIASCKYGCHHCVYILLYTSISITWVIECLLLVLLTVRSCLQYVRHKQIMLPAYKKVTMLNTIESFGCISISDNKISCTIILQHLLLVILLYGSPRVHAKMQNFSTNIKSTAVQRLAHPFYGTCYVHYSRRYCDFEMHNSSIALFLCYYLCLSVQFNV